MSDDRREAAMVTFEEHRLFAIKLARTRARRLPCWVATREELEAAALEGCWRGALNYTADDPTTYIYVCICGEMSDWIRRAIGRPKGQFAHRQRPLAFSEIWTDEVLESVTSGQPEGLGFDEEQLHARTRLCADDYVSLKDLAELALSLLLDRQRKVIVLTFWEGLSLREVGERIGLSKSRTKAIYHTAIQRLRERMAGMVREATTWGNW